MTGFTVIDYILYESTHLKSNTMICICSQKSDQSGNQPSMITVFVSHQVNFLGLPSF